MRELGAEPGSLHLEDLEAARRDGVAADAQAAGARLDFLSAQLLLLRRGWADVEEGRVVPNVPDREVGVIRAPRSLAPGD